MANEISVRTQYTFLSEDGTAYSRDKTYFSDAATTASRPRRIIFTASDVGLTSVMSFVGETFETHPSGPSLVFLINRESARDMKIEVTSASGTQSRILGPKQYLFLDVAQMDVQPVGGGGAFTYAADNITIISCVTDFQSARGEALIIFKPAS